MKKILLAASICLLGSQVQAEPNVYSYTYLPKGTATVELTPDSHPDGEPNYFSVELLDGEQGQIISIFNTSQRDKHYYDEGETVSFSSLERQYKVNHDDKGWINFYASASKIRDYTLLTTQPDHTFTAADQETIKTNGSSEIKKVLRWQVTGSGHVKIRIPFYMRIVERGMLAEENWDGTGRYVNVLFGSLSQNIGSNARIDIDNSMIEQHSIHQRSFSTKTGEYEVKVINRYLTDDGLDLPVTGDTDELKNLKRGVFILEGNVHDGVIEADLTLNTLAFLDYKIDLNKY